MRLGIVDLDSSHSAEFTKRINHAGVSRDQCVDGASVVLASPGTSTMSPERIPRHAKILEDCGVKLVDAPEKMLGEIDGALVLSVCGAAHLAGAKPFLEAGVPTFVDKPFASSLADANSLIQLSLDTGTLLWSSSALRYSEEVIGALENPQFGEIQGLSAFGPAIRGDGNPGLLHYGIHAGEMISALLGPNWKRVASLSNPGADAVTIEFENGRTAWLRGSRAGTSAYGFTAFCAHGVAHQLVSTRFAYRNLCRAILDSFKTGQSPVPLDATLSLIELLCAAGQSAEADGDWVKRAGKTF